MIPLLIIYQNSSYPSRLHFNDMMKHTERTYSESSGLVRNDNPKLTPSDNPILTPLEIGLQAGVW